MEGLNHYFAPVHFSEVTTAAYEPSQIGAQIQTLHPGSKGWDEADIILVGCGEQRGTGSDKTSFSPDRVRAALYNLHFWHSGIRLADAGNIILGDTIEDTYSALATVLSEIHNAGKKAVVLGGSHDLTMAQYKAFQMNKQLANIAVIDAYIDLLEEEQATDKGFLMELLTGKNNFVRHYTHIGFQSYFVNPVVLQTLDRLRFDCIRLGQVREDTDWVEPELRDADILSVDMNALRASEAPYLEHHSPNGFYFDELCHLVRLSAMNNRMHSIGLYGYHAEKDTQGSGAVAIAQMIWYFIDGVYAQQSEASLDQLSEFEHHHIAFTGNDTLFLKSNRTGRWWMQLPDQSFIPCSYQDYVCAANNDIPERWLRAQERIV